MIANVFSLLVFVFHLSLPLNDPDSDQEWIQNSLIAQHITQPLHKSNQLKLSSIVPKDDWIKNREARTQLARIYGRHSETLGKALQQYKILLNSGVKDDLIQLEMEKVQQDLKLLAKTRGHLKSVVPEEDWINDFDTRHALAKVFSYHQETWSDSLRQYEILLKGKPNDPTLLLEMANIYFSRREYRKVLAILSYVRELNPKSFENQVAIAKLEAFLGYAKASRDRFEELFERFGSSESLLFEYADSMMLWGDYYQAEKIFRGFLNAYPESLEWHLRLVSAFIAEQRFDEADGLLKRLLEEFPQDFQKTLEVIIGLKFYQNRYEEANELTDELLRSKPESIGFLRLKARALYLMREYQQAALLYQQIANHKGYSIDGLVGYAKAMIKLGKDECAHKALEKVLDEDPENVTAQFYIAGDAVCQLEILNVVLASNITSQQLQELADLYAEQGMGNEVTWVLQTITTKDPGYFPAWFSLADFLAIAMLYEEPLEIFASLLKDFPENPKLFLEQARVVSWDRRYEDSMALYDNLIALNEDNPIPRLEKARVAYWGHLFNLSMDLYQDLLEPTADENTHPGLSTFQHITALEKRVQCLKWYNQFLHALKVYEMLLEANLGDQGVIFEYAQVLCILGLCEEAQEQYEELLLNSQMNLLAKMALERSYIRENLELEFDYTYWKEIGFGDLDQIARYRFDAVLEVPLSCSGRLRFSEHRWIEHTFYDRKFHPADGQSISWENRYNEYVQSKVEVTRKKYLHQFPMTYTGFAEAWFRLLDYANLGMGFRMSDQIYNFFNLCQKTQGKAWWATLESNLTHCWLVSTNVEHLDYSDRNDLILANIKSSWALTEFPRVFKVILYGEYRNTAHTNVFIFNSNGRLVNIIHPYWAPQHYFAGVVTFEWYHDLSKLLFCGAPVNFYDIKVSFGDDTLRDPSYEIDVEWQYELFRHWRINLKGLIHRSPQWNAKGLWCTIDYRF